MTRLVSKFWTGDLSWARAAVGISTLLWGVLLLSDAGVASMRRPVFATLTSILPAKVWGAMFFVCAVLQLGRLLSGVEETHGWYAVIVAGVIAWLWWTVIATMIIATGIFSPGVLTGNVGIALLATGIFVRVLVRRK